MIDELYITAADIEKSRSLWENSTLVAELSDGYLNRQLFQSAYYYVEVTWHTHFNVVLKVKQFSGTDLLDPYLDAISIVPLFN